MPSIKRTPSFKDTFVRSASKLLGRSSTKKRTESYVENDDDLTGASRSSSLAGQIHYDTPRRREISRASISFTGSPTDKNVSCENSMFHEQQCRQCVKLECKLNAMQKTNDDLRKENGSTARQLQQKDKTINDLEARLSEALGRVSELEQSRDRMINEHNAELKKRDTEQVEREISMVQKLSIASNSAVHDDHFDRASGGSIKTPLSANVSFVQSNPAMRPRSLYLSPHRPFGPLDYMAKDRHQNVLGSSTSQLCHSRSTSTTPDSGAVIPLGTSPNTLRLAKDVGSALIHVQNSLCELSAFSNNWLKNIRPQIGNTAGRIGYVEMLGKLEQTQNDDIDNFLEMTHKQLKNCRDIAFSARRDFNEVFKRQEVVIKQENVKSEW